MSNTIGTSNIVNNGLVLYFDVGNTKNNNRRNLLAQSELFSDSTVWATFNSTVIENVTTDYLGNNTAAMIIATANTDFHALSQYINMSDNTIFTYMVEVKAGGYNFCSVACTLNTTAYTECRLYLNLTTGAVISTLNLLSFSVTNITNGWWRVIYTFNSGEGQTIAGNAPPRVLVSCSPDGVNFNFLGDGVSGVYVARAHLNRGSVYTGYENTTTYPIVKSLVSNHSFSLNKSLQIDYNNGGSLKSQNQGVIDANLSSTLTLSEWTYSAFIKFSKFSPNIFINQIGLNFNCWSKTTGTYPRSGLSISTGLFYGIRDAYIDSSNNIWVGGQFQEYKTQTANYFVRILANGDLDTSTTTLNSFMLIKSNGGGANAVEIVWVDSLGRVYYGGTNVGNITRLLPDGSTDPSWVLTALNSTIIASFLIDETSNKCYIQGSFTTPRNGLAKLNLNDGSLDTSFNSVGEGFNAYAAKMVFNLSKSRIYAIGSFTTYQGVTCNRIVAINPADGTIDNTINFGTGFNNRVYCILVDSNDKIYVGGAFTTYNGISANMMIRLNNDGTIDSTFGGGFSGFNAYVSDILLFGSSIYVSGTFANYQSLSNTYYFVKMNLAGVKDPTFSVGTGFVGYTSLSKIDNNGDLIIFGSFTRYNNVYVNGIVKVNSTTGAILNVYGTEGSTLNGFNTGSHRLQVTISGTNFTNDASVSNIVLALPTKNGIVYGGRHNWNVFSSIFGGWHQWTFTLNSSNLFSLYIDGDLLYTQSLTDRNMPLIKDKMSGDYGTYKAVEQIYNRALTQDEIIKNYNALRGRYPTTTTTTTTTTVVTQPIWNDSNLWVDNQNWVD